MKKLILLISFLILSSVTVAQQQDNKEKYKDYKSCAECFDKFGKTSGYDGVSQPIFQKSGNASNEGKRIVSTISAIFISALSIVIYTRANKAANAIH